MLAFCFPPGFPQGPLGLTWALVSHVLPHWLRLPPLPRGVEFDGDEGSYMDEVSSAKEIGEVTRLPLCL